MDFYYIAFNNAQYYLTEDEKRATPISQKQLGIIIDRLSGLFQVQEKLAMGIRTYMTLYYDNGSTEYISLKAEPSCLLAPIGIEHRMGSRLIMDGLATTFLEGEEENRVWIGCDGAIENRGISGSKVRELLAILIDALNDHAREALFLWEIVQPISMGMLIKQLYEQPTPIERFVDLNHFEQHWLAYKTEDNQWQNMKFSQLISRDTVPSMIRMDIIAKEGLYQLTIDQCQLKANLQMISYPWQDKVCSDQLSSVIKRLLAG